MQVRDHMSSPVFTIRVDKKLRAVESIMEWAHIRHVPVVSSTEEVVGLISHRDLLRASVSARSGEPSRVDRSQDLAWKDVSAIMRHPVLTIPPDASVQAAAGLMRQHSIGCLPVVEGGRLVGIITEADLMEIVERLPTDLSGLLGAPPRR